MEDTKGQDNQQVRPEPLEKVFFCGVLHIWFGAVLWFIDLKILGTSWEMSCLLKWQLESEALDGCRVREDHHPITKDAGASTSQLLQRGEAQTVKLAIAGQWFHQSCLPSEANMANMSALGNWAQGRALGEGSEASTRPLPSSMHLFPFYE